MAVNAAYGQFQQGQHGFLLKCGVAVAAVPVHVAVCKDGLVAAEHMPIKQYAAQHLPDVNILFVQVVLLLRHVAALDALDVQVM